MTTTDDAQRTSTAFNRRSILQLLGGGAFALGAWPCINLQAGAASTAKTSFQLWATSDSHVLGDLDPKLRRWADRTGRESLAEAIRQSEGLGKNGAPGFAWDIGLHLGDFSVAPEQPSEEEGREVVRQFQSLSKHAREDFYCIAGNHDASADQAWFRRWIDPMGENTQFSGVDAKARQYPATGTWERYEFQVGNILFLMLSDRNDLPEPAGRGGEARPGGHPAGSVSKDTFDWWKDRVLSNQDKIIVTAHHHMLRGTTAGSEAWEGLGFSSEEEAREFLDNLDHFRESGESDAQVYYRVMADSQRYHGYTGDISDKGSSYLFFLEDDPDSQAFEKFLAENPGVIDIWLGGHTHLHPDDVVQGRSGIEKRWGVKFINVGSLTAHWRSSPPAPFSRLLTFEPGSDRVRVQCYLHNDHVAKVGWYDSQEKSLGLRQPFERETT